MRRNRPRLFGFLTGIAVTALCVILWFLFNFGETLELQWLDLRFRRFGNVGRDPRIVHVDIDDNTVDRVGRWPWHRKKTADVIRTIHELGASVIAIDLLIDERQEVRFDDPSLSVNTDVEGPVETEGEIAERVYDDDELADALYTAGNAFISIHAQTVGPGMPDPVDFRIRRFKEENPEIDVPAVIARLGLENTPEQRLNISRDLLRERITKALLNQFNLTEAQLAGQLNLTSDEVLSVVAGAKKEAANELVARHFQDGSNPTFDVVCRGILGEHAGRRNADRMDVVNAFARQYALATVRVRCRSSDSSARALLQRALEAEPPLVKFINAARGFGAVNFVKDGDGTVRRIPVLIDFRGRLIKHLGFAVACHVLGIRDDRIEITQDGAVTFADPKGGAPFTLPLDRHGQVIINWAADAQRWSEGFDMPHIPVAKLWSIVDARNKIRENEIAIKIRMGKVVKAVKGDRFDKGFRASSRRMNELERALRLARLKREPETPELDAMRKELETLRAQIEMAHANAAKMLRVNCKEIRDQVSTDEIEADPELRRFFEAERLLSVEIPEREAKNQELLASIDSVKSDLTPHIKEKIVFLGYAATATGDIVPTPIDPETNGVMCHAHLLNTILQKRFLSRPSRLTEILIVCLFGAAVAFLTATGGPRLTLLLTLALMLSYSAVVIYLFRNHDLIVVWPGMLITVFVTWAMVTLFRQLTAEREKRFFAKQLGQYTSPMIAARIAESPEAAQAFKSVQSRDVTCLFTDLASFTSVSEQENAETVQFVLNTYLARMSDVIWRRRGLINKFMGDGIMAFFNASVDPQPDHARNAVAVAVDAFEALEELKSEQAAGPAGPVFQKLRMRAGLASGVCKNGDFGSELKADYTVIGDVVNLSARLEPANKVFGTSVMISGDTRERVADQYEFRYLAELQVKGKARTVPVYEIVCRTGELSEEQEEYIKRFEAGVELYKQRKWDECIVHFTRMLAKKPDDVGAGRYIDACQEMKMFPPDDDWRGALELKEK